MSADQPTQFAAYVMGLKPVPLPTGTPRPSSAGIIGNENQAEEELDRLIDKQFKLGGHPEWASDYKPPKCRQVLE